MLNCLRVRFYEFILNMICRVPDSWSRSFLAAGLMGQLIFGIAAGSAAQSRPPAVNSSEISAKADAARDANRLEEAIPLYKQALALRPDWAEGWWSLGTISYDQNSYSGAALAFHKVVALVPNNGTAYVMLGLSEFELGRDDLALSHIKKGMSLGLNTSPELRHVALYHESVLWQRQGKFQAAQETLQQLCLQGVQSDEVTSILGMTLLRQRSRSVPRNSPDVEIVSRIGHAECLAGQKKFEEGRSDLSALVAQHPIFPEIHYAFGLFLMDANDVPAAVAEFKEEIKNNPADVVSRLQIAAATYKTDSAAGLPYAEESVKLAPRQPFGHLLLGLLLLDTGDDRRAIPELEVAQKAFPRETKIYIALSTAYSRVGRKEDAARARATFLHLTEKARRSQAGSKPPSGEADAARLPVGDSPANQ